MKWKWLLSGVAFVAVCSAVLAQQQLTAGLFGTEAIVVAQGGPGGSSIFTTAGRLSNGRSYAYFTTFRGIPVRTCDAILNNEVAI